MKEIFEKMQAYFQTYGLKVAFAVCIIVLGAALTWLLSFILKKILYKTKIEAASVTFITAIFKIIMVIILVLICASVLELSTSSLVVSLSSLAIAVGLALKDSFANLANGILIIANKPFKRGDYISVSGVDGKVQNIRLLTVELITFNNTKIILPNSTLLSDNVINYSAMPVRRVDMTYTVAYGSDMDLVEKVLHKVCLDNPKILNDIEPLIFMQKHDDSSVVYVMNVWTNTPDYFTVKNAVPREVYDAFEKAGISIPFNQLDVHIKDAVAPTNQDVEGELVQKSEIKREVVDKVSDAAVGKHTAKTCTDKASIEGKIND